MDEKIAILGGGSWATALAKILTDNGQKINWWVRSSAIAEHLSVYRHNRNYLSSISFEGKDILVSTDLDKVIAESDTLIIAIPSAFVHNVFSDIPQQLMEDKMVFSAIKGIIPEFHAIPARYFHKSFRIPYDRIGIISGPCHAEEVGMERLSYLTVACLEEENAEKMVDVLSCRYIRAAATDDLFGTELSTVLKNVYAIASGICAGLGYGDNFQAVLISNAMQELERFIDAVSPVHRDVLHSAYMGDLLVTCYSQFSRNRTFGFMVGKGYSVKSAQLEMNMVAEGYYAVNSIIQMNEKFEVKLPITSAVYNILYQNQAPEKSIGELESLLS